MDSAKIISVANQYVGLHEVKSNAQWYSPKISNSSDLSDCLVDGMDHCGWEAGWPYCIAFVYAVYREAFQGDPRWDELNKKFTPSVLLTYKNFKSYFTKEPVPGSIFIMQKAQGGTGHAGIVAGPVNHSTLIFPTIEGNTSPAPASAEADRNGDGIYTKTRHLTFAESQGLHLLGFINVLS